MFTSIEQHSIRDSATEEVFLMTSNGSDVLVSSADTLVEKSFLIFDYLYIPVENE